MGVAEEGGTVVARDGGRQRPAYLELGPSRRWLTTAVVGWTVGWLMISTGWYSSELDEASDNGALLAIGVAMVVSAAIIGIVVGWQRRQAPNRMGGVS
jgi:hypothetical protein